MLFIGSRSLSLSSCFCSSFPCRPVRLSDNTHTGGVQITRQRKLALTHGLHSSSLIYKLVGTMLQGRYHNFRQVEHLGVLQREETSVAWSICLA